MPNFRYNARDAEGKAVTGYLEAHTEDELIGTLHSRGLVVVKLEEASGKIAEKHTGTKKRKMHSAIKLDDMISFSRQVSALLGAGITLLRSLEIITMQVESKRLHDVLMNVKRDISAGSSMKGAVAKHPKVFTNLWVNIIDTGETTGQLAFALEQLSSYLESTASLRRKIKNALVYPAIIMCVAAAAITVFVVKIIPMFYKIYSGFGAKLPAFSQTVFSICLGIKAYLPIIAGVMAALIFGFHWYKSTPGGRRRIDGLMLNIYVLGDVIRQVAAVRFASGLSMLIKSGTPILHALDIVMETADNVVIKDMLQKVKQNVREGKSMAEPILESGILPDMIAHMVSVGEESGDLANMLINASTFYQERVDATVARLASLFEPILIVFVGVIVGALVVAMFLPIFGLSGVISG